MKTISDHILDIIQNSLKANATLIEIIVVEDYKKDICHLKIADNGEGMSAKILNQAANPFFTTRNTRKVGLGLSLLKQNTELANGHFSIKSQPGEGTLVEAVFQLSNIDRPPIGDVWNTFYIAMLGNENVEFIYEHRTNKGRFKICSSEISENIEGVSLQNTEIRKAVIELIQTNIQKIKNE